MLWHGASHKICVLILLPRGVLDVIALSNFPDMGYPTLINSDLGTLLLVPRERNLSRLYIPLSEVTTGDRFDRSTVTLAHMLAKAKAFFYPFTFDFKVCEWWSVYQASQRVSESNSHPGNRIFLAGDAVHVHSPKVGLGMNVSMQDGYNLGWKVAMAAAGAALDDNKLLSTYTGERYPVAQKLVAYDRTLFAENGTLDTKMMMKFHMEFQDFASGLKLDYPESILVAKSTSNQAAATGLTVGESFKHHKVLGHATSQLYWTTKLFESDGRFRIVLMAGDVCRAEQMERVKNFCDRLESDRKDSNKEETSLLYTRYPYRFTPSVVAQDNNVPNGQHPSISFRHERPRTSMISLLAIHSAVKTNESISLFDFPAALRGTLDDEYYGYDFSRVLVDEAVHYDRYCDGRAYERWGIDRNTGAVVVVRPDMHVGWIGDLDDTDALETYFANILR
jgi:phenol 2-monooxygenase